MSCVQRTDKKILQPLVHPYPQNRGVKSEQFPTLFTCSGHNGETNEVRNMNTLKEKALAYEPPEFPNIVDLDRVSVDLATIDKEETFTDKNTGESKLIVKTYVVHAGKEYYCPKPVLEQLKGFFEKIPNLKEFCVTKSGEGVKTKYQVIPLNEGVSV